MQSKKEIIMLIDSHALLHRGYHAMAGFATRDGRPTGALFGFLKMIMNAINITKPDYIIACYDLPKPTFRHLAYDAYKGTRSKTDEDLKVQINQSKDFCRALNIPIAEMEGFEADDMLGTISHKYKDKYTIVIVSGDMDTLQLVGDNVKVYTLKKGSEVSVFGEKEVMDKYELHPLQIPDYKGLAGDASDNIPGVRGVGPKTAIKILKEFKTVENLYENIKSNENKVKEIISGKIYENIKSSEEDAVFSKTLATIRLDAPIDYKIFHNFDIKFNLNINVDDYNNLCDLYELRSLKNIFQAKENREIVGAGLSASDLDLGNKVENETKINLTSAELSVLQVMSVLLNSEHINIKAEDLYNLYDISELKSYEEIRSYLVEELKKKELYNYYVKFEKEATPILELMHKTGLLVDKEELAKQKVNAKKIVENLEKEIYDFAGIEFNISSPKQLGDIIYDKLGLGTKIKKTSTGKRSTNADMLATMVDEHPIINKIINFREVAKVYNTYIEPLENFIASDDRVHPKLLQAGAATGRYSCEEPNLQNLPRNTELGQMFRKVFIAPPSSIFISADYSQIDLRSAAILSGDEKLLEIFQNDIDIHRGVAAEVLGKKLEDVTDLERRHAKAINFGILYGMGVSALKESMGVERKVAQDFYDNFKNTFSTLMIYSEKVKRDATTRGYTETLFGRRRDIPLLKSHLPFMRAQGERIAINAPIQGTSADIIKLGMIDVYNNFKSDIDNNKLKMLIQIHDELVFECVEKDKEYYGEKIKSVMQDVIKESTKNNLNTHEATRDTVKIIDSVKDENIIPLKVGIAYGKSLYEL